MSAGPLVHELARRGLTVATAESLTGGLVCAGLVAVPGASACVLGGVVAYDYALKSSLLGVPATRLEETGAVNAEVAVLMADGVRSATGADIGLATTGAAGPDPCDGEPPGTVFVAVAGPLAEPLVRRLQLHGGRDAVRAGAVDAVIGLALVALGPAGRPGNPGPGPDVVSQQPGDV